MAAKIEIVDVNWRSGKKCHPHLCLLDDEGDEMCSLPLHELAKALAPYLRQELQTTDQCTVCGGRCVVDWGKAGDGVGGPCKHCDGTGKEPT